MALITSERKRRMWLMGANDAEVVVDAAMQPGWLWLTERPDYHEIATSEPIHV